MIYKIIQIPVPLAESNSTLPDGKLEAYVDLISLGPHVSRVWFSFFNLRSSVHPRYIQILLWSTQIFLILGLECNVMLMKCFLGFTGAKQPFEAVYVSRRKTSIIKAHCSRRENGVQNSLPPLLVILHGGPHSIAQPSFSKTAAFLSALGFSLLHVNYRCSGAVAYHLVSSTRNRAVWITLTFLCHLKLRMRTNMKYWDLSFEILNGAGDQLGLERKLYNPFLEILVGRYDILVCLKWVKWRFQIAILRYWTLHIVNF